VPAKPGSSRHWIFFKAHIGRDLHVAFQITYVYNYIAKLCREQAEGTQNPDNEDVRNIGQSEAPNRKYKSLEFGGGHMYDLSSV
jgi:hypothetical protein